MSSFKASPPNTPSLVKAGINNVSEGQDDCSATRASSYSPLTPPATPSKHPTITTQKIPPIALSKNEDVAAVEVASETAPMATAALKTLLGLGAGKCGSSTKKEGNPPCKKDNPSNIDTQIKSMIALTQASQGLPEQLEKLAELALCQHHVKLEYKTPRIKCWKKAFPVGDEKAVSVEPIEDQIRSVLNCFPYTSSYTCVGAKSDGKPCRFPISGKRVLKGKRALRLIIKPEHYSQDDNLTFLLRVLAFNMFCYNHTDQIPEWVAERKSLITVIYRTYPVEYRPLISTGSTGLSCSLKTNPAEFGDDADDTSAFVTELEDDRPLNDLACYSLVRNKMMEPLKENELKRGYVYIYEVEGNEGFVKIGFTTKNIEDRSAEWKLQCDRTPKVLYPVGPAEKIPHANRVEGLCLAELKYRNTTVICEACPKRHIEWVRAPAAEVIRVVQKWTLWVGTTPFKDSKREHTQLQLDNKVSSWTLRDEEAQRTTDMPKFMQEIAAASLIKNKPT